MQANLDPETFAAFEARIVRYDDAPDECTIHPTDVPEHRRTTAWISAREEAFCSVASRT